MKRRYILYRRKRGGMFYIEDTETRKQESTGTRNRAEATSLLNARNESIRQPHLNLQIAKAYLAGTDSGVATRTWQDALNYIVESKHGPTQDRWRRAAKETALDLIRHRIIIETQAENLFAALKAGTVSTNVHLRKLHNFCISMNWLFCLLDRLGLSRTHVHYVHPVQSSFLREPCQTSFIASSHYHSK